MYCSIFFFPQTTIKDQRESHESEIQRLTEEHEAERQVLHHHKDTSRHQLHQWHQLLHTIIVVIEASILDVYLSPFFFSIIMYVHILYIYRSGTVMLNFDDKS